MSLFVTGTDTGAGKTVLTGLLVRAARRAGLDAVPFKPVQTGWRADGSGDPLDVATALTVAGLDPARADLDLLSPVRYPDPCSPHRAAELTDRPVDVDAIRQAWARLREAGRWVIAEGAGGLLVPVRRGFDLLDLMVEWRAPVVVAARPGLGTINHTRLTLRTLAAAGLTCRGFAFVETAEGGRGDLWEDNARTIAEAEGAVFLGLVPWAEDLARVPLPDEAGPGLLSLATLSPLFT